MSLALYMDHHVATAIADGLRRRSVDVLAAEEDGKARASDSELLVRATELSRVLFSQDDDLLVLAREWQKGGRPFAGLIYAHQLSVTIGRAVRDLELMASLLDPTEMTGRIEFLPL